MPTFRSVLATKIPSFALVQPGIPDQVKSFSTPFHKNNRQILTNSICLLSSKSNKINLPAASIMEEQPNKVQFEEDSGAEEFSKELEVAVKAVHMACLLCKEVQESLICRTHEGNEQVHSKNETSPVTIADWSVQATVSWVMSETFGSENVSIVAEEDVEELSKIGSTGLLNNVVNTVNECLAKAPLFGLKNPARALSAEEVLDAINRCNSSGGQSGKFWVLDPVDGTLGFVRGDQYAIALSLIEDGEPVIGVLGVSKLPSEKGMAKLPKWLSQNFVEIDLTNSRNSN